MANGGYLAGGFFQRYANLEGTGNPLIEGLWDLVTGDLQLLGQGRVNWYPQHDVAIYSWLFFTDQSAALGALKIVGGRQLIQNTLGSVPAENFVWGNRVPYEQEVYSSLAYDNRSSSWLQAGIRLYVTSANNNQIPGFQIVGVRQLERDLLVVC